MNLAVHSDEVDDPLTGVELVAAFDEADKTIFEMCDDSGGNIGDVLSYDAKELFVVWPKTGNCQVNSGLIHLHTCQACS